MNKLLSFICVLALAVLAAVIIMITRPGTMANADAPNGLYTISEGEADMAYGYNAYEYNAPKRISPSRAREIMQSNPDAIILDVRTQQEFDNERIPGAILLPDFAVEDLAAEVLPDKDAVILVYCRAGRRSQNASNALVALGYTNVYDFGGIDSWPYERE